MLNQLTKATLFVLLTSVVLGQSQKSLAKISYPEQAICENAPPACIPAGGGCDSGPSDVCDEDNEARLEECRAEMLELCSVDCTGELPLEWQERLTGILPDETEATKCQLVKDYYCLAW